MVITASGHDPLSQQHYIDQKPYETDMLYPDTYIKEDSRVISN